jgi:hypothetical protein
LEGGEKEEWELRGENKALKENLTAEEDLIDLKCQ